MAWATTFCINFWEVVHVRKEGGGQEQPAVIAVVFVDLLQSHQVHIIPRSAFPAFHYEPWEIPKST